ncbi:unnamed protein product [Peronospora belbahrii]|uniref:UBZ3-type domain-containing protein n=1 Tax=Peronospora belbahrii TaxID=622444 RepID=A0AAU9KPH5_9STRA|nr:unnamed protein product [Peronospora belbahrii]
MHAKQFYDLDSQSVSTISSFFMRNVDVVSSAKVAAHRVEEDIKQFIAKRGRGDSLIRKSSKQKISSFFDRPNSSISSSNEKKKTDVMLMTHSNSYIETTSTSTQAKMILSTTTTKHFCDKCQCFVSEESQDEHADFHFALRLCHAQRSAIMATRGSQSLKKKKKKTKNGPLDKFLRR